MRPGGPGAGGEYLEALRETALGLLGRRDVDDLLEAIIRRAGRIVGSEHGYAYVLEPEERLMRVRAGVGFHQAFVGARVSRGEGLAGRVWETGQPLVVGSYRTWPSRMSTAAYDVLTSVVGVPMVAEGKVIGVLALSRTGEDDPPFGADEVEALTRFAELAAVALDNARLYAALRTELAERRRAQEELEKSELHYRTLFEGAQDAICLLDGDRIIDCNRATERLFEARREDVVGRSVFDFSAEWQVDGSPAAERGAEVVRDALAGGRSRFEWLHRTATGREVHAEVSIARFRVEDRSRLLVISRDITARRRLQARLLRAQKLEAVGQLAGGVAHDFNNIVTAILGAADVARAKLGRGLPIEKELDEVRATGERAAAIVQKLLAFGQKHSLEPRLLDIGAALRDLEPMLGRLLGDRIGIVVEVEPGLPLVSVDPTLVQQVVLNLSINGRDAMLEGGTLRVRARRATGAEASSIEAGSPEGEGAVAIAVSDTGTGIEPEVRERLFEPFFTTKEPGRGTGLGLPTVYGLVRQSGGEVLVESAAGEGSTFTVLLPAAGRPSRPTS